MSFKWPQLPASVLHGSKRKVASIYFKDLELFMEQMEIEAQ